ncbi:MAG TPA: TRAP transporter permease [Spirochaetota bacterium]|nr:TRAP transporter permease [Spirochaetota bacterium]HPJ34088.1 TRAP transporter permease [Spirochaetota bacterium]
MDKNHNLNHVERLVKEESATIRLLSKKENMLVATISIIWALFQLSLASWLILDSTMVRSIHLFFAIVLIFLNVPMIKKSNKYGWLSETKKIPLIDYLFAFGSGLLTLYIIFDYEGIALRMGNLNSTDILIGGLLVLALLEATRRAIGPALPVIAIVFSLYSFFAPYMPTFMATKAVSLQKYINQISMSTEGIYGIPLGVSATIVYLFVLLGSMLDRAGAGSFFTTLALSLLGRYKGGPAKAAVVSSGFSGLISGSSIANIVTTGTFTIPLMKKVGYPPRKAAAIEVAASTDGQLMPPIMGAAAFIIAEYCNVPYIEVVKAAAIPAFVSYAALFYVTHLEASKLGMTRLDKEDIPSFRQTMKDGWHYTIPIMWLIYELVVLRHSAEFAAYHAILILIPTIIFQEIHKVREEDVTIKEGLIRALKIITGGLIGGSKNMVIVALATASAGVIVGVVSMGLGGMITQIVEVLAQGNVYLLLLITAIASLLLGMGLPTTATYIVMASLTAPIIVNVGASMGLIVPLMAAHLFCFYFGILADDTPPVGLAAYAASAIAKSDPIRTGLQGFTYDLRTAIIPFFFIFNPDLILHGINSWPQGLLIFTMAVLGAMCFTSAVQGWFTTNNKWWEVPLLLAATVILFNPGAVINFFKIDMSMKYYMYLSGMAIMGGVYAMQKIRVRVSG